MNDTWIKLYRKILNNNALFRSRNTFPIWCWLLLMADYKTGIVTCGRHQISQWLKIKPSTVYLTLKRLENLTMIKMKPNNKMTTIYILNWHEYQSKPNNKVTTNQQQSNTNQEYKNKELRIYRSRKFLEDEENLKKIADQYSVPLSVVKETAEEIPLYEKSKGKKYKDYRATLQQWIRRRIKNNQDIVIKKSSEEDPLVIAALRRQHDNQYR